MRVNRSKKYRKIMSSYCLHFGFRTPYQILCDSNFLRTCYNFKMPISQFLNNTVHGEARPYLTQCTLAAATRQHKAKVQKGKGSQRGRGDGKPEWLPLPTEVPLRYCKHKNEEGEDIGPLSEEECLLDLLRGQPKGNEAVKNKNHYILASADTEDVQQGQTKNRRAINFRQQARLIGGVPVIYVSKSVMILEELSGVSMTAINRLEKAKLKEGLISKDRGTKRKREDDNEDDSDEFATNNDVKNGQDKSDAHRSRGQQYKAKAPNPLSVRKKKIKSAGQADLSTSRSDQGLDSETAKKKNRRIRGKKHKGSEATVVASEISASVPVSAEA